MDFKIVSKNNTGVFMTLILIVLLSQSRLFDFLIDTPLGRMILLAFVIFIAYTNKILGLVAVLFIIIASNQNDMSMVYGYNYYEGFDISGNDVTVSDISGNLLNGTIKNNIQNKIQASQSNASQSNASQTTTTTSSSESFKGREGFCMTDRESNMLRGKQSSAVPIINNIREQSDDISPSDKSVFASDFATF